MTRMSEIGPPSDLRPMKATTSDAPPSGDAWAHEVKWDGMRLLARLAGGAVTLTSTNGLDATARFPELQGLADACGCDAERRQQDVADVDR